jgi:hypothetical protein
MALSAAPFEVCGVEVAELIRYTLDDGSEVAFEAAESNFVTLRGGAELDIKNGGQLSAPLTGVGHAAEQIANELRSRLCPDEVTLEFGLKVSGSMNLWFFARAQSEGTINVTLRWQTNKEQADSVQQTDVGEP